MTHLSLCVLVCLTITFVYAADIGLIVGEVSPNNARILYWDIDQQTPSITEAATINILIKANGSNVPSDFTIQSYNVPQILRLNDLEANTDYQVLFKDNITLIEQIAMFHTPISSTTDQEFIFLSCNRIVEQLEDTEMWETISEKYTTKQNRVVVHLGDQVYADNVAKKFNHPGELESSCISFNTILSEFRRFYSQTWKVDAVRQFLKSGSNIMLLDDHDIVNNLNFEKWNTSSAYQKTIIRAGIQAFFEFQHQLYTDIPTFPHTHPLHECCLLDNVNKQVSPHKGFNYCKMDEVWNHYDDLLVDLHLYRATRRGNVGLIYLDTRFTTSFHHTHLFGDEQLAFVNETLSTWSTDDSIQHIFISSSVPIIYQSSFMADIAFFVEKERYSTQKDNLDDTGKLLDILFQYPTKLKLFSGDIHMFLDTHICRKSDVCIPQLITSGMTSKSTTLRTPHLLFYSFFAIQVFGARVPSHDTNDKYYLKVNDGFLDNNFVHVEIKGNRFHYEVEKRTLPFFLAACNALFYNPHIIYFFLCCFVANSLFCFLYLVLVRHKNNCNKAKKNE